MLKLLLLIICTIILFSQKPPTNQFSLGLNHQFTAYSISYEKFVYKYNSLELGIAYGGSSLNYDYDNVSNSLMIPINYKMYLPNFTNLDGSLNHTFVWKKRSITLISLGFNSSLDEGLNFRIAINIPLSKTEYNTKRPSEFNIPIIHFLNIISFKLGYRF